MCRVRNEVEHRKVRIERVLVSRDDQIELRWFRQVQRLEAYCVARHVLMEKVYGRCLQDSPQIGWMNPVKVGQQIDVGGGGMAMHKR